VRYSSGIREEEDDWRAGGYDRRYCSDYAERACCCVSGMIWRETVHVGAGGRESLQLVVGEAQSQRLPPECLFINLLRFTK